MKKRIIHIDSNEGQPAEEIVEVPTVKRGTETDC